MKKKVVLIVLSILMVVAFGMTGCTPKNTAEPVKEVAENSSEAEETNELSETSDAIDLTFGVAIRKFDDTFLTEERNNVQKCADELGITVDIVDSQANQVLQNDKVDLFLTKGYDAICVNLQDRMNAQQIIDKVKDSGIPVVFFNTEPPAEALESYDNAYYVGAKAEESGIIQGNIIVEYWNNNADMDTNNDGVLQYVMLKGEPGHQDAELRTEYSIKTIEEAGIKVEKVAEDTAMWDRVKGQDKMATFLAASDNIEAVLANNDDMALGAIEALKAVGYFKDGKYMPVVGVDATVPGKEALKELTLLGTSLNDAKSQGYAVVKVAKALCEGQVPSEDNVGYNVDGQYVWVPYVPVTIDNVAEFAD